MKKPFKLLIAVPCMDYLHAEFVKSLQKLTMHLCREGVNFTVEIHSGSLVYFARNRMANKAVDEGYTHLLFMDSDMVFDETIVETLEFSGKGMVCGVFHSRRPPYGSCIFKSLKPVERFTPKDYGVEPFRIMGCGMACTMISSEILRAVRQRFGNCFDPAIYDGITMGEDTAFCWRVNNVGEEMWCDPTAKIGHIAHVPIWPGEEPAT